MREPQKPHELTDEEWAAWPKCAVPACLNKCCLRLRSKYCWPHTTGSGTEAADNLRETEPMADAVTDGVKEVFGDANLKPGTAGGWVAEVPAAGGKTSDGAQP